MVLDSTGLKVFGEGEWKVRSHGVGKRGAWSKLHLAIDSDSHKIISAVTTTNDTHDSQVIEDLIGEENSTTSVTADGADDTGSCYEAIAEIGANPLRPPRKGAIIKRYGNCKNQNCLEMRACEKLERKF